MNEQTPFGSTNPTHRKRRNKRLRLTGLLAGFISLVIAIAAQTSPDTVKKIVPDTVEKTVSNVAQTVEEAQPGLAQVTHVVDGDTIDVLINGQKETVRFIGMDTPETHDPRKPVQCFGEVAAAHTKALLEGKNVRLEPDPADSDRDKYHRLLRYVYLPDGTLVNATLIHDGYAFAYIIFPFTKLDDFRALEQDARENNRGLWAGCNINESSDIKQTSGNK